jgi:hypothetical protein
MPFCLRVCRLCSREKFQKCLKNVSKMFQKSFKNIYLHVRCSPCHCADVRVVFALARRLVQSQSFLVREGRIRPPRPDVQLVVPDVRTDVVQTLVQTLVQML